MGINAILYYSSLFFAKVDSTVSDNVQVFIVAFATLVFLIPAAFVIQRSGYKPIMVLSLIGGAIAMVFTAMSC